MEIVNLLDAPDLEKNSYSYTPQLILLLFINMAFVEDPHKNVAESGNCDEK